MKKFTLNLLLIFAFFGYSIPLMAQNYLIDFAILNEALKPESILIENLDQGTSLTISGMDTLNLVDEIIGIDQINTHKQSLHIYPNPVIDQAIIEFYNDQTGMIDIHLLDITGRTILQHSSQQSIGQLSYQIKGLKAGSYVLKVSNLNAISNSYEDLSTVIISQASQSRVPRIELLSNQLNMKAGEVNMTSSSENSTKKMGEVIKMQYNEGETLKFTAYLIGEEAYDEFIAEEDQTIDFEFENLVFDIEDNIYKTKIFGEQRWMIKNLGTSRFRDSTEIPTLVSNYDWTTATTPAFCWWEFNQEFAEEHDFGALYNWFTVETENLCPIGWHVPSNDEFEEFVFYIAANGYNYDGSVYTGTNIDDAGSKIGKALAVKTDWIEPTYGETWAIGKDMHLNNETGFNGIGADGRYMQTGVFFDAFYLCNWWTSTAFDNDHSWTYFMYTEEALLIKTWYFKEGGYSVRCIKDE